MEKEIRKFYIRLILPALGCDTLMFILEKADVRIFPGEASGVGILVMLFASAFSAMLLPLWLRIFFIRGMDRARPLTAANFVRFQKRLLVIALIPLYMVPAACLFRVPQLPLGGIALFAFYGAYFYFPSAARISLDRKIFRVRD
ncbi:hypothetical protein DENIS_4351 [Desulfonema ishimotonii]|uniref:Uncharacterized protein n=2 Tax=Desulfonema ishimotonii TaxID=45657 RepID=A0A401G2A6_9BACT|nr:hypothetical protein DENIS_4351 [Desulfonema ishimotonii]